MNAKLITKTTVISLFTAAAATFNVAEAAYPGANGLLTVGRTISWPVMEVLTINPDGTGALTIIPNKGLSYSGASWSPDGKKITFHGGTVGSQDIFVANANGSGVVNLTKSESEDNCPNWSPDGLKIAFQSNRDGNNEIYVMNADGSDLVRLTNKPGSDEFPRWSPDGKKIAFVSDRTGNQEIYLMNVDGTNPINITKDPANDNLFDWSPDGSKIVFHTDRSGNGDIYLMNNNGSNQVNLTKSDVYENVPVFSPDGTMIAYQYGGNDAYIMYTDGSEQRLLATNLHGSSAQGWQPIKSASKTIVLDDIGFNPSATEVSQGSGVRWKFMGSIPQAVMDDLAMGSFGSGMEPSGGSYAATFYDAGSYYAFDPSTLQFGAVSVPLKISPANGPIGAKFTLRWSTRTAPAGQWFDVSVKLPGSTKWVYLVRGAKTNHIAYRPKLPGTYAFRARLRSGGGTVYWSPEESITVN